MLFRRRAGRVEPRLAGGRGADIRVRPEDRSAPSGRPGRRSRKSSGRRGKKRGGRRRGFSPVRLVGRSLYWGAVLSLWLLIAGAGILLWYGLQLPHASNWRVPDRPPNVQIVSVAGELIGNRGETGGEPVRLFELPRYVGDAVIAIEDRRFRSHFGLDPVGLARAALRNLLALRAVEGGSTLTQQLAKNLFLTPERSFRRKVQELVLSFWLEASYSKDAILEMYLNRVYFGGGAYGIDAAARRFFDRPASELTLAQAATLAGLLRAPSRYAPDRHPARARERASLVLAAMEREGLIAPPEAESARRAQVGVDIEHLTRSENYVADWVMDLLPDHVGAVDSDIVVETTIDLDLQREAEWALTEALAAEGETLGVGQGALVAIDGTGAVRALVGGRNYAESQFNRAVQARRQPGSAFKPMVYLTALERGLTPNSVRVDEPVRIGNWQPQNFARDHRGPVTLTTALALSLNTVAARLAAEMGPANVAATARRLGIRSELQENATIALGTSEVSLLDLTGAYATFANGGFRVEPHVIRRIRTAHGDILFEQPGLGIDRAVALEHVAMMNHMLRATIEIGTGRRANVPGWPAAGKTGTTQEFRDAWFVGYTANLTTGVWLGNDANEPTRRASGSNLPANIWTSFMGAAHRGVPVAELPGAGLVPAALAEAPAATAQAARRGAASEAAANEALHRQWILNRGQEETPGRPPARRPGPGLLERIFGR